ncbi:uncharacterized protein LOC122672757 isoform X2 [Telopea speciosissima]|uniref:uncharacterized protein LOC122672757 isoform X2 n=1 Tax=Telopea speciosissima TaxID=54955 RepID=UPI001CC75035|nr:uncharacterized protein LOC122672757 isoform X2 [Telopea speciosissima]XP_043726198.1 uncharacterized protein LOC122672757 isoform X2 [Telopea speciosissima]
MIRLCSCSEGSASTIDPIEKRVVTASCKTCGGKPLVDGRASLSGSMLSTGLLELTSVINPELTWKTISKGNRSASRRARKPISRNYKRSGDLFDRDPEKVEEMPVSESEKLGVTVLGRRFSDKVEHIPIKKRRFLFRSPSPPPRASSPHPDEACQHASGQESSLNAIVGQKIVATDTAVQLGQVVDTGIASDGKYLKEINGNLGESEDFSGISILAAAACNNSMDGSTDNDEDGSALEVSSVQERSYDVMVNKESCLVVKEPCRGLGLNCAQISDEGTGSCISVMHVEETIASLVTATSSPEDMACKTNAEATEAPDYMDNLLSSKQKLPSDGNETSSSRYDTSLDDRSQWDLNTVMDAWESPCGDHAVDPQEDGTDDIFDGGCNEKPGKLEGCEQQREPADTKLDLANTVWPVVGGVVGDEREGICCHTDSRSSTVGCDKSNRDDHKVDAHASEGRCERSTCFQEKVSSSEINSAPNILIDLDDGSRSLHNQERTINVGAHQFVDKGTCINHSSLPVADKGSDTPVSEENGHADSAGSTGKETGDDYPAEAERAEHICSSPQSVKDCTTLSYEAIPGDMCRNEKVRTEDGEDAGRTSGLHADGSFPNKPQSTHLVACDPLQSGPSDSGMDRAVCSSEIVHHSPSTNCEVLPGSEASAGRDAGSGEHAVGVSLNVQDDIDFVADATVDSPDQIESEELTCKPLAVTTGTVEAPGGTSSHEVYRSCADDLINISGNVAPDDDHFDDVDYGSDVSQDDPQGMEKENEPQADYDSQFEDGEFRESVLHGWEGDAYEEGEAEHVDYGSDNREAYDFEAAEKTDCPGSMSVQVEELAEYQGGRSTEINGKSERDQVMEKNMLKNNVLDEGYCEKRLGTVSRHLRGQFGKRDDYSTFEMDSSTDNEFRGGAAKVNADDELYASGHTGKGPNQSASLRMKFSGWDQLPEGSRSSVDKKMEARDGDSNRLHSVARMDGPDSEDSAARMATTARRELHSRIERPTSDVLYRKDRFNKLDESNRRAERGGSSLLHMHGRGRGGDRWVDSSHWGPERHRSPGFGHPGPKNAAAAAAAKIESSGFVVAPDGTVVKAGGLGRRRQSVNASLEGVRRSLVRRGSPSERDEALGMHMDLDLVGEMSPDRSIAVGRDRSGRFGPRVVDSGLRERYHGPAPDDSSLRMLHPSVTRERSYSPIHRRGAAHISRSRTNSPSRSRTRSPHVWPSPRGRNGCGISSGPVFRHHSRSPPNFRSEARMDRVRSPHRRPGFLADHVAGFTPTSRIRGSPQHSSRWVENRKDAVDHFREHGYKQRLQDSERRVPGRIFPRSHRFDLVGSTGRSKPDEYYRPIHHGRFNEMVGAGRGSRYDESDDDRRKHGHRYEFVHHVRRYDTNGPVKRFRYDVEDGFAAHESHNKEPTEFHSRGSPKTYDRGIDSRLGDAPRRSREERGHFRYGRDWKYNSNSKSFGMR